MNPEHVNDVSHMYQELPKQLDNGKFACPVCGKDYATRAGIFRHMGEQDCAPADLLFKDTITETLGHEFFKTTVGQFNKHQRTNLNAFRKSKFYKSVLRFTLHCMSNKADAYMIFDWVRLTKKPRYYNHAISACMKDTTLVDFRKHLIQNEELIDSEAFYEQNEEELLNNQSFLVRSLQRGDIGLDFCLDHPTIALADQIDKLAEANRIHLLTVINAKEGP